MVTQEDKYLVLGKKMSYFVRKHAACANKYSVGDIVKMLDFLINNIFVEFGGRVFQQTVGIPNWPDRLILLFAISMMFCH